MTHANAPVSMDSLAILTLALSTGFATAVFNQGMGWLREVRHDSASTERDARYLAIRLAVMLEEYAINCADRIGDNDMHRQSGGHAGKRWGALPELQPYPNEDDWKALAPDLLSRVLTLRIQLSLANNAIAFWMDIDPECIPQECDQQCGRTGYAAWTLARDMRSRYRLGTFEQGEASWVIETLERLNEAAIKAKREQQK